MNEWMNNEKLQNKWITRWMNKYKQGNKLQTNEWIKKRNKQMNK